MNREQTLEAIKVMQHFADGGEVEFCNQGMWCCAGSPTWELNRLKYRIKPKPLEFYVDVSEHGVIYGVHYKGEGGVSVNGTRCVRVREVTE